MPNLLASGPITTSDQLVIELVGPARQPARGFWSAGRVWGHL
jgi:hypothetical protein